MRVISLQLPGCTRPAAMPIACASTTSRCCALAQPAVTAALQRGSLPGLASCSSFCGAKLLGVPPGGRALVRTRPRVGDACVTRTQRTTASFFGVGAPEALLVAVVALVVFGPKGLADAAASLGKTLRTFQPTIRELADISTDLKSTLEKEIGLDEIRADLQRPPASRTTEGASTSSLPSNQVSPVTSDMLTAIDPDIEAKRKASAAAAWGNAAPASQQPVAASAETAGGTAATSAGASAAGAADVTVAAPAAGASASNGVGTGGSPSLEGMSVEELERELARRKAAQIPQQLRADEKSA